MLNGFAVIAVFSTAYEHAIEIVPHISPAISSGVLNIAMNLISLTLIIILTFSDYADEEYDIFKRMMYIILGMSVASICILLYHMCRK